MSASVISFARQTRFVPEEELRGRIVHIIGCGGIGSIMAVALAKLGVRIFVLWDPQDVEGVNIPCQGFTLAHVRKSKAEELAGLLAENGATSVTVHKCAFEGQEELEGIVVSAVDTIEVRSQVIWPAVHDNVMVELFIDGRLGGDQLELFMVRPNGPYEHEGVAYEETFFDADEAEPLECGGEAYIGPTMILTGLLIGQILKYLAGLRANPPGSADPWPNYLGYNNRTNKQVIGFWEDEGELS